MLKLRKMLTEILLDVTSEEIQSVAAEAYDEEQSKVKFVFKEPKFKPKRAKTAPNVLGTTNIHSTNGSSPSLIQNPCLFEVH